uniref:Photosystem II 12 kDa extrinsic protein n=1 Tax=Leptocylindrus danicus TaxID=163516 RepID=A0A7S2LMY5_9STRA|mmetsp:Transcript_7512/g.11176  ORF Transcript_7512/g.11176 Transcript_7512/m.11176 type:complete len:169 (+) Transcript_7512:46-552(+)|eukprot:CAMPEP_0116020484 /NCGR_PEP_ID=MMETSP0321-20121206/9821_1 /TAXON_ID=163516 /ORGANISM="Leptocylindrus danicus var. danicus, Strain B650" /LENGTH=168 /DNA_ID=CAMNT_0003491177 /DNA_START=35 /DNA_END=541 /DNA_ORIENTATION=+
MKNVIIYLIAIAIIPAHIASLAFNSQNLSKQTLLKASNDKDPQVERSARRELFSKIGLASSAYLAMMVPPVPAHAVRDFANVGLLGGSNVVDVNNANIRVYLKMQGMYPNIARKIAENGPYKNVGDIFNIPGLTEAEKTIIRRHESKLTATKPSPEYFIDRINNGLYR